MSKQILPFPTTFERDLRKKLKERQHPLASEVIASIDSVCRDCGYRIIRAPIVEHVGALVTFTNQKITTYPEGEAAKGIEITDTKSDGTFKHALDGTYGVEIQQEDEPTFL